METISKQRRQVITGGLAALGSFATRALRAQTPSTEELVVTMDWLPSWRHAAFHLAKVKGWYREAGLDVRVEDGSGSTTTIVQTFTGKCDVGLASLSTMAVARSKGANVVAVAGIIRKNDLGLFVDRKLGISNGQQLEHRNAKVLFASTGFQSLFPPFFQNLGANIGQLSLVPMSTGSVEGAYLGGQGDALITTVPYILPIVERQRPSENFMFADYGLPLPAHGLLVSRSGLERRQSAVQRFLAVTEKAWHQVWFGDTKEAIDALVDQRPYANVDAQLELSRAIAYKPFSATDATRGKGDLWMAPSDWEAAVRVMRETEILPATAKATDFYTNAFVRES
jgi:NitT/TauT family transport system substrate-binding protein